MTVFHPSTTDSARRIAPSVCASINVQSMKLSRAHAALPAPPPR
jgi:hypothetical protein